MAAKRLIAYLRVSTKRQGQSGLGLDAQRAAVDEFSEQLGGMLEGVYIDIESGREMTVLSLLKP